MTFAATSHHTTHHFNANLSEKRRFVRAVFMPFFLAFAGFLLFTSTSAYAFPQAFHADYSISKDGFALGKLRVTLSYIGSNYRYKKETRSTGIAALLTGIKIEENVKGKVNGNVLKPESYVFKESRHTKTRQDNTVFNGNTVRGRFKNQAFSLTIPDGVLDRASLELALAHDLQAQKQRFDYVVVEKGRIKDYRFIKTGTETIRTALGEFETVKLTVQRNSNNRQTTFWMARNLNYLPVKIYHNEKGDEILTEITHYRPFQASPSQQNTSK